MGVWPHGVSTGPFPKVLKLQEGGKHSGEGQTFPATPGTVLRCAMMCRAVPGAPPTYRLVPLFPQVSPPLSCVTLCSTLA